LAQKVFSPYADFQRSVFGALNFFEINYTKPPFSDRRIRQALSISIERERLSEAELEGTTQPAFSFLPFASASQAKLVQDKERARELFEQAGFAGGHGFPMIRLVVNRNETQQRLAREVMRMWKEILNVETQLVVKENNEIAETRARLDFDVLRRGIVFPVSDEFVCITSIHSSARLIEPEAEQGPSTMPVRTPVIERPSNTLNSNASAEAQSGRPSLASIPISSEEMAIFEMRAIPLYFPVSFALVKPYVLGFEMNSLDVQSLGVISIDSSWQPR
jgi:oligopeptide transport system substrate-binding protein